MTAAGWGQQPGSPPARTPPSRAFGIVAFVVLGLGVVAIVVGIVLGVTRVVDRARTIDRTPVLDAPGTITEHVHAGTYYVYEQTPDLDTDSPTPELDPTPVPLADITISVDGASPTVTADDSAFPFLSSAADLESVARFSVPHAGTLTLTVTGSDGEVAVAPSFFAVFRAVLPGLITGIAGFVAVLVGVVLVIVWAQRRKPPRPPWSWQPGWPPPGWGSPPGWGPPPGWAPSPGWAPGWPPPGAYAPTPPAAWPPPSGPPTGG